MGETDEQKIARLEEEVRRLRLQLGPEEGDTVQATLVVRYIDDDGDVCFGVEGGSNGTTYMSKEAWFSLRRQ